MNAPTLYAVRGIAAGLAAFFALTVGGAAHAQTYPSKPVRLLVPLAAGSTADIVSRFAAQELGTALGQSVVVENRPGAGGTIAMAELARAAPDGYTIAFASQGTLVFNQAIYANPGYDSTKDFAPVSFVGGVSNVMIVPPGERRDQARGRRSRKRRQNPASSRSRRAAAGRATTCPACCSAASRAPTSCTCRTRARRRACWP